jgi:3-phosphoshikimate 1-carboxyvinyltransferase
MSTINQPTKVTIQPGGILSGTPSLPGAKYATVRIVLCAALGNGPAIVRGLPQSDDTTILLHALRTLNIDIAWLDDETIQIAGCDGYFPIDPKIDEIYIDVGNAGAVLRFLLGITAILPFVRFTTPHPESLGRRPNVELLRALEQLGVRVTARTEQGFLPITLLGADIHGGYVSIDGSRSSQFLSALLFLAPLIGEPVAIEVTGALPSASFVRLTLDVLSQAGITIMHDPDLRHFTCEPGQHFLSREWQIPRDYPTAATWLAAGALAGDSIILNDLPIATEDGTAILASLRAMGASIDEHSDSNRGLMQLISRRSSLHGAQIDGSLVIDSVPVLAALASFADGTTTFTNVAALRLKESDRIGMLCDELNKIGVQAIPGEDTIVIHGQPAGIAGGATVDAHSDHRLAMALALAGLRAHAPITIIGAQHVAKSYPAFWRELVLLGGTMSEA